MKQLPSGLQAHLDGGATTLCWCWRLTRRDEVQYGFTDHDNDLQLDGTLFEAASGFSASELQSGVGLSTDNLEAEGALMSNRLNEADLARGRFDDARVEIFRVNWQQPDQFILMSSGSLGEVRRGRNGFQAEIRGLAHYLQQPGGRLIQYGCDAILGDQRCGIDVGAGSVWRHSGRVLEALSAYRFKAGDLDDFNAGWFSRGSLIWQTGQNAGISIEIKQHMVQENGDVIIELWQNMVDDIETGDRFELITGCDKQFSTCRDRFQNQANFRGFPHVPGNDFIVSYPGRADIDNDGGSLTA
jgi:uncharacterized phage protein (TIGR02218 family)